MPATVAATITTPEMISSGKNHQPPVEIEISRPERKRVARVARVLARAVVLAIAAGSTQAVVNSVAEQTRLGRNVHGHCACTR